MTTNSITTKSDVTVELIDSMGDLQRIVEAARVSTKGADARGSEESEGLVRYLFNNKHASPFEHVVFTFCVQAPIFVTREMLRHRISSFNEESGRYSELKPLFYVPGEGRPLVQVGKVGAYNFVEGDEAQRDIMEACHKAAYTVAYGCYQTMLDSGIAREVARNVLPVGLYSSLYYTANLRSLTNFLSLRVDWGTDAVNPSSPTYEIELVALEIGKYVQEKLPFVWELFVKNGYQAV
jgi:thymidylate synthase (FAD)